MTEWTFQKNTLLMHVVFGHCYLNKLPKNTLFTPAIFYFHKEPRSQKKHLHVLNSKHKRSDSRVLKVWNIRSPHLPHDSDGRLSCCHGDAVFHQIEHVFIIEQTDEVEGAEAGGRAQSQISDHHGAETRATEFHYKLPQQNHNQTQTQELLSISSLHKIT